MPNLMPLSQTVWPEHSAFIFQYFGDFRAEGETSPIWVRGKKLFGMESINAVKCKPVCQNQAPKPKTLARTIFFILPYIGLYRAKREVLRGGRGEEGVWHFKIWH